MRALVLLLATAVTLTSFAAEKSVEIEAPKERAPKLKAPHEFIAELKKADPFISAIVTKHEQEFPGALNHNYFFFYTSLNRISYIQQGLVTELMTVPGFKEAFESREPMTDFKITVTESMETGGELVLVGHRWDAFIGNMDRYLETVYNMTKDRLKKTPTRKQYIQALRDSIANAWARSDGHPYESYDYSRVISYATIALTVIEKHPNLKPKEVLDLIYDDLEPGALDYLEDSISYLPLHKGLAENTRRPEKYDARLAKTLMRVHDEVVSGLYERSRKSGMKAGDSVTIREVHPDISIFRGYVGNDCATCFSPGFVFNPFDRYYYVFDGKGKRLGYAGISLVKVGGERAIFLHTIQGPDFSSAQTELVMRAFQEKASALGATRVVLGRDSNIGSNVNFEPIRSAMMRAVSGKPELAVEWEDMQYREIIAKWDSQMTYDDPERNKHGRELTFDNSKVSVTVEQKPFDFTMTATTPEMIASAKEKCSLRLTGGGGKSWGAGSYGGYDSDKDWDW